VSNYSPSAAAGLSISAVAARTGVSVPVLRAWERRFGFPVPARLPSGHRRYGEADVERIRQVIAERDRGRSLESAIARARSSVTPAADDASIFSGLRRARPDLQVHVLSRRAMLSLSRAIEDEGLAHADRPHLVAAFQHEAVYRRAARRWDELAVSAASTIVLADFATSRHSTTGAIEVALPQGDPNLREWCVVCDAPDSAAVLAGRERAEGTFEALWTVDPDAVRLATGIARRIAAGLAPDLVGPALADAAPASMDPTAALRRAEAVTNRAVAYLDG
jgi:DNA-binding transcriptional MerR regulator